MAVCVVGFQVDSTCRDHLAPGDPRGTKVSEGSSQEDRPESRNGSQSLNRRQAVLVLRLGRKEGLQGERGGREDSLCPKGAHGSPAETEGLGTTVESSADKHGWA